MGIFEYLDYKKWVRDRIQAMPKQGRGQLKKIADHLGASPAIISQVFGGERELTPEQALLLSDFFSLNKAETRFLVALVNFARAGTHRYRESLEEEIEEMRGLSRELSNRVKQNFRFTDEVKAALYSNWYYLAIWSLTSIEGFGNLESISKRLAIPPRKAREAVEFLLRHALIVEDKRGRLKVGPSLIHLESTSPQIPRHHQNWRLQAFRHHENPGHDDVFYSAPVTLSAEEASDLRESIIKFIAESVNRIKDSKSEKLFCLNIDWFEV
jgi:uncharacterized protein (TIGR02147 family)